MTINTVRLSLDLKVPSVKLSHVTGQFKWTEMGRLGGIVPVHLFVNDNSAGTMSSIQAVKTASWIDVLSLKVRNYSMSTVAIVVTMSMAKVVRFPGYSR